MKIKKNHALYHAMPYQIIETRLSTNASRQIALVKAGTDCKACGELLIRGVKPNGGKS